VITVRGGSCAENAHMPLVVVDDIEMYYESRGSGPALVVIGGLGLEMSELDTLVSRLASSFRVVAFDNRGAGRSSKPRGPPSARWNTAAALGRDQRTGRCRAGSPVTMRS